MFGIPGDGINGIIEALRQKQDKIRFVQVRHEEAAAFAASGFTIERPEECGRILDQALATDGPVVVKAVVDPQEPPMPPRIRPKAGAAFR